MLENDLMLKQKSLYKSSILTSQYVDPIKRQPQGHSPEITSIP